MTLSTRATSLAALLALALLPIAPFARGDAQSDASKLYQEGIELRDKSKQPREGLAKLRAAYAMIKTSRIALEIGRTHMALNEFLEAEAILGEAVTLPAPTEAKKKAAAQQAKTEAGALLQVASGKIAKLTVKWKAGTTPKKVVRVDGTDVASGIAAGTDALRINPGKHVVEASPPLEKRFVEIKEGEPVVLELEGIAPVKEPDPIKTTAPPPPANEPAAPTAMLRLVVRCGDSKFASGKADGLEVLVDGKSLEGIEDLTTWNAGVGARVVQGVRVPWNPTGGSHVLRVSTTDCDAEELDLGPQVPENAVVTGTLHPRTQLLSKGLYVRAALEVFASPSNDTVEGDAAVVPGKTTRSKTKRGFQFDSAVTLFGAALTIGANSPHGVYELDVFARFGSGQGAYQERLTDFPPTGFVSGQLIDERPRAPVSMASFGGLLRLGWRIPWAFGHVGFGPALGLGTAAYTGSDQKVSGGWLLLGGFLVVRVQPWAQVSLDLQYVPGIAGLWDAGGFGQLFQVGLAYHFSTASRDGVGLKLGGVPPH